MADSTVVEPMRASVLLQLEGTKVQNEAQQNVVATFAKDPIVLKGLDKRFAGLWHGGRVVGIGGGLESSGGIGKLSLSLEVIAEALFKARRPESLSTNSPHQLSPPNIYIILPHSTQTIATLHAHLANNLSNPQHAIDLLRPVQLLQYFDLAGLAESVAEVSEKVYQASQQSPTTATSTRNIVLVQDMTETVATTQRRSGLVQANALLASLLRNIAQLARAGSDVLVLIDVVNEVGDSTERLSPKSFRSSRGIELDSAFTGFHGETLRLVSGHETLSRALEADLDCIVTVHDGLGRATKSKEGGGQIVEVVKDRSGDLTGLWDVWKG